MSTNEDAEQAVEKASEKAHEGEAATNENGCLLYTSDAADE